MSLKHLHRKLRNTEFESNEFDPISAFESQVVPQQSIVIPKDRFTEPKANYNKEIQLVSKKNTKLGEALEKLNNYQLQAVFSADTKVLLSAMVGSGKTTVLTHKILYLHFVKAIPLSEMIVLTFTNKAAREIRERILSFYEDSEPILTEELRYFGTFHSVARQLIKEHPQLSKLGFTPSFSIMDKDAQEEFLNRLILSHDLDIKYKNKLDQRLKAYRNEKQILYGNMKTEDELPRLLDISRKEKQANNLMDFDDLISIVNWLLKREGSLEPKWVIVDEFQDCNTEQVQLLNHLSVKESSFFAVGDPNQSIYAWRGSTDQIFESYITDKSCCMMRLPLNYRTSGQLLNAAAYLLNEEQNDLQATRDAGRKLRLMNHFDDHQEAFYYCQQLKELHKKGTAWEQMAILFRTRQQIAIFESIFQKEGIPFEVISKSSLKDYPVLFWLKKVLLAGLQANDFDSILAVFTSSKFGCLKNGKALINAFDKFNSDKTFKTKIEAFTAFLHYKYPEEKAHIKLADSLLTFQEQLNQGEDLDIYTVLNFNQLLKPTSVHYTDNAYLVKQALQEIDHYIQQQSFGNKVEAYQAAMSQVSLEGHFQINTGLKETKNGVRLLTIHAAKGLEFDHVYLSGANSGLIPLNRKKGGPKHLQEEKRLLFVALTRAKNHMEISWHSQSTAWNAEEGPSYFLNAIPSSLIERIEASKPDKNIEKQKDKPIDINNPWTKGLKISHPKYGEGLVISSTQKEIVCEFGKFGEKSFAPQWAPLKAI